MGRIRKTLRFTFSIGGTHGLSPIAKQSETNALLTRIADGAAPRVSVGPVGITSAERVEKFNAYNRRHSMSRKLRETQADADTRGVTYEQARQDRRNRP